ncbi:MAG TPA: hypothetical protein VH021_01795 [Trebonia sp.]|nr:hypothetical protein [Trebonia sp.]
MFRFSPPRAPVVPWLLRRLGPPPLPPRRHFSKTWYSGARCRAVSRRPGHR